MSDEVMIDVENVSRRFRRVVAIQSVSLTVHRGELFGVLGPDGAGKTTLLRMMAAVLDPSGADTTPLLRRVSDALHGSGDEGRALPRRVVAALENPPEGHITVGEFDTVQQSEAVKAQLGYMPQRFALYGDLSVDENLSFAADVFGVTGQARQDRTRELLAFAGLESFRARRVRLLSGGMKKKLALACALIHRPAILLLDEPTTGVDPVARRDFWDLLSGLHAEGITTVVSTPYMDEAERCNRVALLYEGRLLACDTPETIKRRIPGQVLALAGPDIRAASDALQDLPYLLSLQTYGDQLSLIVDGDLTAAQETIRQRLEAHQLPITRLERVPIRMEEAFIYLVKEAREGAAA